MKLKTIQMRLLAILLPLVILVLGALAGVSYYLSQQALDRSVDTTARAVGTDYSYRVQSEVLLMIRQLEDLASLQRVRAGSDKNQIVQAMKEFQQRLGIFDAVIYISPDGAGISDAGQAGQYSDRNYVKQVLQTKQAAVSNPLVSRSTGKLAVVLAVPVTNNGQLNGILIGTFSMERLSNAIADLKFLDTGYGQLADDDGLIIAHPHNAQLTGKLNLREKKITDALKLQQDSLDDRLLAMFRTAAESGQQARGEYAFVDGVTRIAVFRPIELPGGQRWVMTVAAPAVEATREISALARTMLVVAVLSLLAVAVAIILIARWFAKPIVLIRDECMLLADGDLRERDASVTQEDEIGQLAQGFRQMRTALRALVTKVNGQSEQLAASSEELTASAEQSAMAANQVAESISQVATGADKQVNAVNAATSVVEQLSAGIQQVAVNANLAAEKSIQAAETAKTGGSSLEKAVRQMTQIEETVNSSAGVVTKLGERSKEIGQIVDTISGIAGQTNLLALNAAIEAARAGEQGRGFAVVAEEVRKLAEQSQDAAKQIAALIGEIQGDTDQAVVAMNNGTREVKVGTEVVTGAGQAFGQIAQLVTEAADQVREMAAAIQQMANGSQLIVSSVQEIETLSKSASGEAQTVSAATEEQSASMQEIASSSQSLAQLAQELQQAVGKFRV